MLSKSDEYWASVRQVPLTKKKALWTFSLIVSNRFRDSNTSSSVQKPLIENFVETSGKGRPEQVRHRPYQHHDFEQLHRRNPFPVEWYDDRKPQSTLVP